LGLEIVVGTQTVTSKWSLDSSVDFKGIEIGVSLKRE
jgi:hypothetical protein